jgi:hypothetical protein
MRCVYLHFIQKWLHQTHSSLLKTY